MRVVNTRPESVHRSPATDCSAACSVRCRRSACTHGPGSATTRVESSVLVSSCRSSPATHCNCMAILIVPSMRSTSFQRSPSASPRRMPSAMATTNRACSRCYRIAARKVAASATLHVLNRCRRGRVGSAKLATLRVSTSSATATPNAARSALSTWCTRAGLGNRWQHLPIAQQRRLLSGRLLSQPCAQHWHCCRMRLSIPLTSAFFSAVSLILPSCGTKYSLAATSYPT